MSIPSRFWSDVERLMAEFPEATSVVGEVRRAVEASDGEAYDNVETGVPAVDLQNFGAALETLKAFVRSSYGIETEASPLLDAPLAYPGVPLVRRRVGDPEGGDRRRRQPPAGGTPDPRVSEEYYRPEVLIVGAGAAGVSLGACCEVIGVRYAVVEKLPTVGDVWRRRYARLHLHDPIDECHLPYMPMPDTYPTYPSREEFADYLEAYAKLLRVDVRCSSEVTACDYLREEEAWTVQVMEKRTKGEEGGSPIMSSVLASVVYRPQILVICTGMFTVPRRPAPYPGEAEFRGQVLHSTEFKSAAAHKLEDGKRVVVVGFGNSGMEQLLDLWEHRAACTALVRSPRAMVPRWVTGLWFMFRYRHPWFKRILDKVGEDDLKPEDTKATKALVQLVTDVCVMLRDKQWGDLRPFNLELLPASPFATQPGSFGPIQDLGAVELIKKGEIKVEKAEIQRFRPDGVVLTDGQFLPADAVIFATGYKPWSGYSSFMSDAVMQNLKEGSPQPNVREHPEQPNLWFMYSRIAGLRNKGPVMAAALQERLKNRRKSSPLAAPSARL